MLFLVIDRVKMGFVPSDVSLAQLKMIKQTFEMYKGYMEVNKLKAGYIFADIPGGITIWDVESNEELQRILFLLPTTSFMEREVRPLTNIDSAIGMVNELIDIVKSMPTTPSR